MSLPLYRISRTAEPYLDRYYVAGPNPSAAFGIPHGKLRFRWLPFTVYLHRFHRGDQDSDLHNHPWRALSVILWGGYIEEYLLRGQVHRREYKPGRLHWIRPSLYHRIDLRNPAGAWTLVLIGRRVQRWGFRDRETLAYREAE